MGALSWIIGFTLLGGVASVLLASLFLLLPERTRLRAMPSMVAFATGALLAAALVGLLPEAVELAGDGGAGKVGMGLLVGIGLFFVLEKLVLWRHCHDDHCETHDLAPAQEAHRPTAPAHSHGGHSHGAHGHGSHAHGPALRRNSSAALVITGDTMHNVLDGVLIAAAFLTDIRLGIVTGLAVMAHEIPSEVGNFAVLLHGGLTRTQAFGWNLLSGLGSVAGGVIGYFALSAVLPWLPVALAVSAAGLLYVAVADLIPGLHRRTDARTSVAQVLL
ncbi:MAG: ZIP family metal transporter, partial [Nevskiaceae bacterium]|nr:ZIP family metal transporter [Nevskiaceae bacterium]